MTRGIRHGPWLQLLPIMNEITNINQYPITPEDIEAERRYRIEERLGIMCGTDAPTDEQLELAIAEADTWVREYYLSMPE